MTTTQYLIEVTDEGIRLIDPQNGAAIAQDGNPLYAGFVDWVAAGNIPSITASPEP